MTTKVYPIRQTLASLGKLASNPLSKLKAYLLRNTSFLKAIATLCPLSLFEPIRVPEKDLRRKDFLGKGATDRKVLPITFSNRLTKNRVATHSHLSL